MPRHPKSLATQAAEMAVAVPQVIAHRMTRMAMSGPNLSDRDRKEFTQMSSEKVEAFTESWQAMGAQVVKSQMQMMSLMMQMCWSPQLSTNAKMNKVSEQIQRSTNDVLSQGLKPVHQKAMANAKRLKSTQLK